MNISYSAAPLMDYRSVVIEVSVGLSNHKAMIGRYHSTPSESLF